MPPSLTARRNSSPAPRTRPARPYRGCFRYPYEADRPDRPPISVPTLVFDICHIALRAFSLPSRLRRNHPSRGGKAKSQGQLTHHISGRRVCAIWRPTRLRHRQSMPQAGARLSASIASRNPIRAAPGHPVPRVADPDLAPRRDTRRRRFSPVIFETDFLTAEIARIRPPFYVVTVPIF